MAAIVAAIAFAAAMPMAATAETVTEPPTEPTTPETTPPPSTGWVPQGSGGDASGGGGGVQHGSSLGSGGRSPSPPAEEQPSYTGTDDSGGGYYEPQAPTATGEEESASPFEVESSVDPVQPPVAEKPAPRPKGGLAAVDGATVLSRPERLEVAGVHAESSIKSATLASDRVDSGPGALWWLAVIVGCLLIVYTAGRLLLEPTEVHRRSSRRPRWR